MGFPVAQPRGSAAGFAGEAMSKSEEPPRIKISCPGCDALLKFKRIPTRLVQPCPNCRRLLRLQDMMSVAQQGDDLQSVIDDFVSREPTHHAPTQSYEEDPRLDETVAKAPGILQFNQPWPDNFHHILYNKVNVVANPFNLEGNMFRRQQLLKGYHRRVTVVRTGEVEEMVVVGHWHDRNDDGVNDGVIGTLPRTMVRELNRLPIETEYSARINYVQWRREGKTQLLDIYVDVAKNKVDAPRRRKRKYIK